MEILTVNPKQQPAPPREISELLGRILKEDDLLVAGEKKRAPVKTDAQIRKSTFLFVKH